MTLTMEFPPETDERLRAGAERHGQDTGDYVRTLVERELTRQALAELKHRERPQSLDELKPRRPSPPGMNGLAYIAGKWPGDETDEEIDRALEELS